MKKARIRKQLVAVAGAMEAAGGRMPFMAGVELLGRKQLKKARRRGVVEMSPDQHTGRIKKDKNSRWKFFRFEHQPLPNTIFLTTGGRELLAKKP